MTAGQVILFALLGVVFALLLWGRWRCDAIAFVALLVAVAAGVVPVAKAFEGFGHPATVIIALVLVVSRALSSSGAVDLLTRHVIDRGRSLIAHVGVMSALAAVLSPVMNNIAALALLVPVELEAAARGPGAAPGRPSMPLSLASVLGGLVTLIGTPPGTIISAFRAEALGAPFSRFDFTPVGAAAAAAGVAVAASCAFLTPIGHQQNTLILGPGGHRFGGHGPAGGSGHRGLRAEDPPGLAAPRGSARRALAGPGERH